MTEAIGPRVAIAGNGPRALWALERLDAHLHEGRGVPPSTVHVFGRGDFGAGQVYDAAQPDYLRLNVTSSVVDAWCGDAARGPSYDAWREDCEPGSTRDAFPARALTGRYLREQGERVIASLTHRFGCEVRIFAKEVHRLARSGDGWAGPGQGVYDEVLLAVGHAVDWPGALRHSWPIASPPLQPNAFPVADLLARPEVRPGATVVVRGAALTAIDVMLALTLGRGRRPMNSDLTIVLTSRTGRLMLPKADPRVLPGLIARGGDLDGVRAAVAGGAEVTGILRELAARFLGGGPGAEESVAQAAVALGAHGVDDQDPVAALRHGVAMARGELPPNAAYALGQAWRLVYPDLVRRQRRSPAGPPLGWPDYVAWSRELERLAFGPPLVNAELLLEGLAAGTVRVHRGPVLEIAEGADLVVDAVLPPPGILDRPSGDLLSRLRETGVLARDPARRGARVADDATVIDAAGVRVPGLALVGRAGEDDVLGNDTLIRDLHPEIDRWAQRILSAPFRESQ